MTYAAVETETDDLELPPVLSKDGIRNRHPYIWAIGNTDILSRELLGFFCSTECPGSIVLKTYDLARSLRDAGDALISGFHSPIEKDALDLLLNGSQSLVVCPARSIENMRIASAWKKPIGDGRLLVLSPSGRKHRRVTAWPSDQRNRFVALLSAHVLIPYAERGSRT